MDFNPDQYLAEKTSSAGGFDPDAYLQQKTGGFQALSNGASDPSLASTVMPADKMKSAADYWTGKGDNPAAGAEVPAEQRLANNIQTVGSGMVIPEGIASLGKLAGLGKAAPEVAKVAEEAPKVADAIGDVKPPLSEPAQAPKAEAVDPLKDVKDYINSKYGQAAEKPGFPDKIAEYIKDASLKMGAKDIGIQPRQVYGMGHGFEGPEKAKALVQYAMDNGYLRPGLTDLAREAEFKENLANYGKQVGALRDLADQRGPAMPLPNMLDAVKQALGKYTSGVEAAPGELQNVLDEIQKATPTHAGYADLATTLNKAKTPATKMSQSTGPMTDAANLISRLNNEAIKTKLNPDELKMYEDSLRNFGAHKALEQTLGRSMARELAARTNQRGLLGRLFQETLDRGGYRVGANVANRVAKAIGQNPAIAKSLPQFFETLEHTAHDVLDDSVEGFK